ncbi:OLC1v1003981C1 [Oldenlandia corymbosa var. corymbosa]|uniref:OLC1v1003981C1 n=1 Tax=Oldenlandia corymbosa var. corymbosa TaxID=529605 RepID=A0AAV1DC08_OLDCO|nr:OLC1v1003981C1 [Oldenlandia corymbosa var. corymbosa]
MMSDDGLASVPPSLRGFIQDPNSNLSASNPNNPNNPNPNNPNSNAANKRKRNLPGTPGKKDSFITHRAFCDALAEESARFTTVPPPNLNFRNELFNGGLSNLAAGNPQFPGGLIDPLGSTTHHHQLNLNGQKPRLPLWLDNANPGVGNNNNSNNAFLASSSSSLPDLVQMNTPTSILGLSSQNQWGSFPSPNNPSPSGLQRVLKEEEENRGDLSNSISSLYYNSNQSQHHEAGATPAPMSATALLQKAAQMGSTRSNPSLFGTTGFGLMSSSLSSLSSFNSMNNNQQTRNDQHQIQNFGSVTSSSTVTTTNPGDGLLLGNMNTNSLMGNVRNNPAAPNAKSGGNNNGIDQGGGEGSLTRDFLGVGGNHDHHQIQNRPFLQQSELVKFASSMSNSAMEFANH